MGEEMAEIL